MFQNSLYIEDAVRIAKTGRFALRATLVEGRRAIVRSCKISVDVPLVAIPTA